MRYEESCDASRSERFDLSIVVPTYREVANLPELLDRIEAVFSPSDTRTEVIVVDDNSRDGTEEYCANRNRLGRESALPLRLVVRRNERGLSSAVIRGMDEARGEVVCVMDADLSHPPEQIPAMMDRLVNDDAEFVIGSRYVRGGSTTDDWGFLRWLNSKAATIAARPFTSAADPMAGFFALRRREFSAARSRLDPIGYKIGLELIVKASLKQVAEVPIRFANRKHGESKLTLKEQLNYLRHLGRLFRYQFPSAVQLTAFLAFGLSGMVIDVFSFAILAGYVGLGLARGAAIGIAMNWNYLLHRNATFAPERKETPLRSYLHFIASCSVGLVVNWTVSMAALNALQGVAGVTLISSATGAIFGAASNFLLLRNLLFESTASQATPHTQPALSKPALSKPALKLYGADELYGAGEISLQPQAVTSLPESPLPESPLSMEPIEEDARRAA